MKHLFCFLVALLPLAAQAQDYQKAVGFRGGQGSGVYFRKFMDDEIALEAILGFRSGGAQITFLREKHQPIFTEKSDQFLLGVGFGGHVGFTHSHYNQVLFERYYFPGRTFFPLIGLDAWVGLEYRFRSLPLVTGLSLKPGFDLFIPGFFNVHPANIALSIGYTFNP